MLPAYHKLGSAREFTAVMSRACRAGSQRVVVYLAMMPEDPTAPVVSGGPRFGLIVSKAVGNAVTRHRLARRLRHVCRGCIPLLPRQSGVVIRALPAASAASSAELEADIRRALARIERKGARAKDQRRG